MDDTEVYEIWVGRIVDRFKKGEWNREKGLREHIIHHSLELKSHGNIPPEWIASMTTLVDIAKGLSGYNVEITVDKFEGGYSGADLRDRIIDHAAILINDKLSCEWIMTMVVLIKIADAVTGRLVTRRLQIERLYSHWRNNMGDMEPPPFEAVLLEKKVGDTSSGIGLRSGDS